MREDVVGQNAPTIGIRFNMKSKGAHKLIIIYYIILGIPSLFISIDL